MDLARVLAADDMVHALKRAGWTGEDIKQHVTDLKTSEAGFAELDTFSGGELSKMAGRPSYPLMLELTALRFAMHKTQAGGARAVPPECPHGFRMMQCNRCRREAA